MALPTITRTWKQLLTTGTPGARIAFVSVLDSMQQTMFRLKDFLCSGSGATTKYSVLWSASGGTGPTNSADHTDRITSAATWTPRATVAAASQAWVVLTDGNAYPAWQATHGYVLKDRVTNNGNIYECITAGTSAGSLGPTTTAADITDGAAHWIYLSAGTGASQILMAFQGASDDISRISYSPSASFTLAGTTNNQPTAADEQVFLSATSIVNSTASADRILHLWASDDARAFRVAIYRSSALAGPVWGVEAIDDGSVVAPAYIPCRVWGFNFSSSNVNSTQSWISAYQANALGGLVRSYVSSVYYNLQCGTRVEGEAAGNSAAADYTFQPELQGSGFDPWPVSMHTRNASGSRGRIGTLVDWWHCAPSSFAPGDGFGASYQFHQVGSALWPNPANVAPTIT